VQPAIALIFDTVSVNGFTNDLGTGVLANNTELGCASPQLTAQVRLICQLSLGSTIAQEPAIIVTGFNTLPASSTITLYVTNIRALSTGATATVEVAVQLDVTQTAYIYGPTPKTPPITSPLNSVINTTSAGNALAWPNAATAQVLATGGSYTFSLIA
jgi:hypothetical protein